MTTLILLSAPAATAYYPHIGMIQHDSCWITGPMRSEDYNRDLPEVRK